MGRFQKQLDYVRNSRTTFPKKERNKKKALNESIHTGFKSNSFILNRGFLNINQNLLKLAKTGPFWQQQPLLGTTSFFWQHLPRSGSSLAPHGSNLAPKGSKQAPTFGSKQASQQHPGSIEQQTGSIPVKNICLPTALCLSWQHLAPSGSILAADDGGNLASNSSNRLQLAVRWIQLQRSILAPLNKQDSF